MNMKEIDVKRSSEKFQETNSLQRFAEINQQTIKTNKVYGFDDIKSLLISLCAFLCILCIEGVTYSMGMLSVAIMRQFSVSFTMALLPPSLMIGTYSIIGPLGSFLDYGLDQRPCAMLGAFLAMIAGIGAAFVPVYWGFVLLIGVVMGAGFGLFHVPCLVIVAQWTEEFRAVNMALVMCGAGAGLYIFSRITPYLLENYGLRGCMLFIVILCLISLIAVIFFQPVSSALSKTSATDKNKISQSIKCLNKCEENNKIKQHIIQKLIEKKERQLMESQCSLDGKVLTMDCDVIDLAKSMEDVTNKSNMSEEEIRNLTVKVIETLSKDNANVVESIKTNLPDLVKDYINSKLDLNHSSLKGVEQVSLSTLVDEINDFIGSVYLENEREDNISFAASETIITIPENDTETITSQTLPFPSSQKSLVPLSLFYRPTFLFMMFITFISGLVTITPYYFFPFMLHEDAAKNLVSSDIFAQNNTKIVPDNEVILWRTISDTYAAVLLAYMAGKAFSAYYIHKLLGQSLFKYNFRLHNIILILSGVCLVVMPHVTDKFVLFWLLLFIYIFGSIFTVSMRSIMINDFLGQEALTSTFIAMMIFQGIAVTLGIPLHAVLWDYTGSLMVVFWTIGGITMLSGFLGSFIRMVSIYEYNKSKAADNDNYDEEMQT